MRIGIENWIWMENWIGNWIWIWMENWIGMENWIWMKNWIGIENWIGMEIVNWIGMEMESQVVGAGKVHTMRLDFLNFLEPGE
jgi:hypothetical protein